MCQVHTGAYVSLLAPVKTSCSTGCHPRKTTTYTLHVVSITTHTHHRRKWKETKKRKEDKGKERKKEKAKKKLKRKGNNV